jgi:SAM-dependent methyltransferase
LRNVLPRHALLTAIDISDSMMEVARAKFLPHEQVPFQVTDAVALPFEDEAFDAVVCQFGVMFFDKDAAFHEAPDAETGRALFVQCLGFAGYNPFASLTFEVMKQFFPPFITEEPHG